MIKDDQQLVRAVNRWGSEIKTYDDGFGPLWIFRQLGGIAGIVRAQNWESAYEIIEDDILTPIPADDVIEAYGYYIVPERTMCKGDKFWHAHEDQNRVSLAKFATEGDAHAFCEQQIETTKAELVEGYSYQSNATGTGIVQHDLNGESLDLLTKDLLDQYEIVLTIENG